MQSRSASFIVGRYDAQALVTTRNTKATERNRRALIAGEA
ncbi:Hypothetical protein CAP_1328 [Chondromyces apiculatus DSM 436]|uniref:Uncharacterized protein n=1 Tax=Chondromyces apiculatus DSM 436 TaxID=1192034 RepID=A0A017TCY4_9BACT|nr:Hypothetical protein CAP_1328 [Chondromyces apiculatus DSM 436]